MDVCVSINRPGCRYRPVLAPTTRSAGTARRSGAARDVIVAEGKGRARTLLWSIMLRLKLADGRACGLAARTLLEECTLLATAECCILSIV